jgi:hypothetical protein
MNLGATLTALKHLTCWFIVVFFVALLTFIFSFLGTIMCAVLTGMMLGAMKYSRWRSIPVALIFPGVSVGLLQVMKTEMMRNQILALAALCFATFWLGYLMGSVLISAERKAQGAPAQTVPPDVARTTDSHAVPQTSPTSPACARPAAEFILEELEGHWCCEPTDATQQSCRKLMEIKDHKLALTIIEADGHRRRVADGNVRLESSSPLKTLILSASENALAPDTLVSI